MKKNCFGFAAGLSVVTLLMCSGCGSGSAPPIGCSGSIATCVVPEFLYATTQNQIFGFTVNPATGALSSPTATAGPAGGLGLPSFGIVGISTLGFVYVSDPQNNQVDGFAVNNSTGALSPLPGSPFPMSNPLGLLGAPGLPGNVVADPQGRFLYAANRNINVFSISATTGSLTSAPSPPITGGGALELVMDPSGKFLYSALGGQISAFTVDPNTGVLTAVPGSPFSLPVTNVDATDVVVDSTGHFVYVIANSLPTGGSNNYVLGFSIDTTSGSLSPVLSSPSSPTLLSPFAMVTSGSFLYAGTSSGISAFSIGPATGVLTELNGSPFATGSVATGLAISQDGKFLFEAGTNGISAFAINPASGVISSIGNPVSVPARALALTLYHP